MYVNKPWSEFLIKWSRERGLFLKFDNKNILTGRFWFFVVFGLTCSFDTMEETDTPSVVDSEGLYMTEENPGYYYNETKGKTVSFAPYLSTSDDGQYYGMNTDHKEDSSDPIDTNSSPTSDPSKIQQMLGYHGRHVSRARLNNLLSSSMSAEISMKGFGGGNIKEQQTQRNLAWNEKFQEIYDALPDEFDFENMEVHRGFFVELLRVTKDFVHLAELYGKIIISEKELPDDEKTIKPIDIGGIAGGSKYMKRGIMFKFPQAEQYGLYSGSDEMMIKAASHEFKGLLCFIDGGVSEVHHPLMALIDYRGYRLVALTLLPINKGTMVYGSADGGKTILKKDEKVNNLIETICTNLNLKAHMAGIGVPKLIYSPADIEVHIGTDNRYYAIDFSRIMPPEYRRKRSPGHNLVYRLRPEFVRKYPLPLSSDAYSGMGNHNSEIHNTEVKEATMYLIHECLSKFKDKFEQHLKYEKINSNILGLSGLENVLKENVYKKAQTMLISEMHREGLNLRYMGRIRKISTNKDLRKVLLVEMISRVLKNTLKKKWRNLMKKNPKCEEESYKLITAKFLNIALGSSNESSIYWQFHVKPELIQKFPDGLTSKEMNIDGNVRDLDNIKYVFYRVLRMCQINLSPPLYERIMNDPSWLLQPKPIRALDIISIDTKIKTLNTIPFVEGLLLLDSMKKLTSASDKVWILQESLKKFKKALRVVPGGRMENFAYSKVLYKRASIDTLNLGKMIKLLEMAQHGFEYIVNTWENDKQALFYYAKVLHRLAEIKNNAKLLKTAISKYELYMENGDPRGFFRCARAYSLLYKIDGKHQSYIRTAFKLIKRAISSDPKHPGINTLYAILLSSNSEQDPSSFAECDTMFAKAYTISNNLSLLYWWARFSLRRVELIEETESEDKGRMIDHLLVASNKFVNAMERCVPLDFYHDMCNIERRLSQYQSDQSKEEKHSETTSNLIQSHITKLRNAINRCLLISGVSHDRIIGFKDLTLLHPIGDSPVSFVFKGTLKQGNKVLDCIIKSLNRKVATTFDCEAFDNDINTLLALDHPNVIKMIGKCFREDREMIVLEYCQTTVVDYFGTNYISEVPWKLILQLAYDIAKGFEHIHDSGIIHNYITAENILLKVDENGNLVPIISNFLLSILTTNHKLSLDKINDNEDLLVYNSPEKISRGEISYKTDIYSFGILLWEFGYCMRVIPMEGMSMKKKREHILRGGRPPIPTSWNRSYAELIEMCISHEKDVRPSMSTVVLKLGEILNSNQLNTEEYVPPTLTLSKSKNLSPTSSNLSE